MPMTTRLHEEINNPAPLNPYTMLIMVEAVMLAEGGLDHPWIPGSSAKPLLVKIKATIEAEKAKHRCTKLPKHNSMS